MTSNIVTVAREWVGTPYADHQSTKGVAVDCIGFIIGVAREVGIDLAVENYRLLPTGDSLIQALDSKLTRVDRVIPQAGDVLAFKTSFKGVPTHLGIASDKGVIHADSRVGKIVEVRLGYLERLLVGYWVLPVEG